MQSAQAVFQINVQQAKALGALHGHLSASITIPDQFDDLLRSQLVYAVSAFDKLMHDIIRTGMVEIFERRRPPTAKYLNESVAMQHLPSLQASASPPPAVRFEQIVRDKHSFLSFQDPDKIVDGLSYIWGDAHKWQTIAAGLGMSDTDARRKQRLIVTRRNAIVHEADIDPITQQKQTMSPGEAKDAADFLLDLGNRICALVT